MKKRVYNKVKYYGADILNLSEDTIEESDVTEGKTFHDRHGDPKVGTVITKSIDDISIEGNVVNIPSGRYEDVKLELPSGSVVVPDLQVEINPIISLSQEDGVVAASINSEQVINPQVIPGYVEGGTSGTLSLQGEGLFTLPSITTNTITPGTSNQVIESGKYLKGNQTILGDENLVPSNIKEGISIFGVMGEVVPGESPIVKPLTVTPKDSEQVFNRSEQPESLIRNVSFTVRGTKTISPLTLGETYFARFVFLSDNPTKGYTSDYILFTASQDEVAINDEVYTDSGVYVSLTSIRCNNIRYDSVRVEIYDTVLICGHFPVTVQAIPQLTDFAVYVYASNTSNINYLKCIGRTTKGSDGIQPTSLPVNTSMFITVYPFFDKSRKAHICFKSSSDMIQPNLDSRSSGATVSVKTNDWLDVIVTQNANVYIYASDIS